MFGRVIKVSTRFLVPVKISCDVGKVIKVSKVPR